MYLRAMVAAIALLAALPVFAADAAPPTNDSFESPILVPGVPYTNVQSTLEATLQPGEPQNCNTFVATIWYSLPPSVSGLVKVATFGSTYDTSVAVYTGNDLATLNLVTCDDDTGIGLQSAAQFTAARHSLPDPGRQRRDSARGTDHQHQHGFSPGQRQFRPSHFGITPIALQRQQEHGVRQHRGR